MACFLFDKYKTYLVTLPLAMVGHFEVALFVFELQIPQVHLAPKVSRYNSLNTSSATQMIELIQVMHVMQVIGST